MSTATEPRTAEVLSLSGVYYRVRDSRGEVHYLIASQFDADAPRSPGSQVRLRWELRGDGSWPHGRPLPPRGSWRASAP